MDYRNAGVLSEDGHAAWDDDGAMTFVPSRTVDVYGCPTCGALVDDTSRHDDWHAGIVTQTLTEGDRP